MESYPKNYGDMTNEQRLGAAVVFGRLAGAMGRELDQQRSELSGLAAVAFEVGWMDLRSILDAEHRDLLDSYPPSASGGTII